MASEIKTYRDLIAWQKAFAVGIDVYKRTEGIPERDRFGLTVQLRRSADSVPSNIAEGWDRGSTADYVRLLKIARGSLCELETQLLFAVELGYVSKDAYAELNERVDETERVLAGLIRSLER